MCQVNVHSILNSIGVPVELVTLVQKWHGFKRPRRFGICDAFNSGQKGCKLMIQNANTDRSKSAFLAFGITAVLQHTRTKKKGGMNQRNKQFIRLFILISLFFFSFMYSFFLLLVQHCYDSFLFGCQPWKCVCARDALNNKIGKMVPFAFQQFCSGKSTIVRWSIWLFQNRMKNKMKGNNKKE